MAASAEDDDIEGLVRHGDKSTDAVRAVTAPKVLASPRFGAHGITRCLP